MPILLIREAYEEFINYTEGLNQSLTAYGLIFFSSRVHEKGSKIIKVLPK